VELEDGQSGNSRVVNDEVSSVEITKRMVPMSWQKVTNVGLSKAT
jgi:hypothetical protein